VAEPATWDCFRDRAGRHEVEGDAGRLEVITTSQKLAHRIVATLKKTFGGRASYAWSDRDGSLFATWERDADQA